jgi:cyclophilin family peptidyl-prolyl cis-trans isomerase/HEAT repeat protein
MTASYWMRLAATLLCPLLAACVARSGHGEPLDPLKAAWADIVLLEDARTDGAGRLEELLTNIAPAVRARAATALGRVPRSAAGPEATEALVAALSDPDADVRAAAAFALGMRGDPVAGESLLSRALDESRDADGLVRARCIEAASKLERPELRLRTLEGLRDADPRVRVEAAEGAQRWSSSEATAGEVDRALAQHLEGETDRGVVLYALASLERRKATAGREAFLRCARADDAEHRIFAVRGLAAVAAEDAGQRIFAVHGVAPAEDLAVVGALERALGDPDWRVACEAARSLGSATPSRAIDPLGRATRHASPHVRRCAWEAIGAQFERLERREAIEQAFAALQPYWRKDWLPSASRSPAESSSMVREAAIEACLRVIAASDRSFMDLFPDATFPRLRGDWPSQPPEVLAGLARGLTAIPAFWAYEFLAKLTGSQDLRVSGTAIEALGKRLSEPRRGKLRGFLEQPDNGLRLAAVTALSEAPDAGDLPALERAFDTSSGDIAAEVRFNILRLAGKIGGQGSRSLLLRGAAAPQPFVRQVAREELARLWPDLPIPETPPLERAPGRPLPGADLPLPAENPRVAMETTRGTFVFELLPAEAPVHVQNFLALAERGYYDGLTFHRVVPDFVVQGGDYRGDGNGGITYRVPVDPRAAHERGEPIPADSLRHEISPRKFVRGSLGMPRNDDPDSGGSQIFITHRPTPHLDGRYTIFGELRSGGEVLDRIEAGDHLLEVRVLPR